MIRWQEHFESGDIAFILFALVIDLLVIWPGLTAFYLGALALPKPSESIRIFPLVLASMSLAWCLWGYSVAFGPAPGSIPRRSPDAVPEAMLGLEEMARIADTKPDETPTHGRGGLFGGTDYWNFQDHLPVSGSVRPVFPSRRPAHQIPNLLFLVFHMALFVVAPTPLILLLIGRMSSNAIVAFSVLWGTFIYAPLAHWIWGDGWLEALGAVDTAGGLIHVGIGFSALACGVVIRFAISAANNSQSSILAGSTLANFGAIFFWIGTILIHGALTMHVDGRAAMALMNTHLAACAGALAWMATSKLLWGQNNDLDAGFGALSGIIAMAPCCGLVVPQSALIIGAMTAMSNCCVMHLLGASNAQNRSRLAFVMHGLSGTAGLLFAAVFATSGVAGFRWDGRQIDGVVEGNLSQIGHQALGVMASAAWGFFGTCLILVGLLFVLSKIKPNVETAMDTVKGV